ncbi:hypothetical protein [uncultured Lamprocystis sp.]|uniref:hypothetical protein n=1 Tax=uncultured Lamprocystis sp. TaxID=543132 RepID=UPI0025EC54C6|nr:hypothetical protein [uncultured Lamprocystis sp.]
MPVELGPVGVLGDAVEVGEEVELLSLAPGWGGPIGLAQQVVNQNLGVNLLLNVEGWRVDDEIAPILLILAAPDELWIEVAVALLLFLIKPDRAASIGHRHRILLILLHHRLIFGRRDVPAGGFVVGECFHDLSWLGFARHINGFPVGTSG